MKLSTLLVINAIIALLFGLGFVLAPTSMMSLYSLTLKASGLIMAHIFGAALIGFGLLTWSARKAEESQALHFVLSFWLSFFRILLASSSLSSHNLNE